MLMVPQAFRKEMRLTLATSLIFFLPIVDISSVKEHSPLSLRGLVIFWGLKFYCLELWKREKKQGKEFRRIILFRRPEFRFKSGCSEFLNYLRAAELFKSRNFSCNNYYYRSLFFCCLASSVRLKTHFVKQSFVPIQKNLVAGSQQVFLKLIFRSWWLVDLTVSQLLK